MHEVELNNVDPLYAQCLKVYCYDIESFRRQSKQIKNKKILCLILFSLCD